MTILEKLIAGGLEQTEAERMIAVALRNGLLARPADAEPLQQSRACDASQARPAPAIPSDSSGVLPEPAEGNGSGASAAMLEDKPETSPETQVETVEPKESEESAISTEQETLENSKAPVELKVPREAEMSTVPDTSALIANLMAAEIRGCALECGVDAKRLPVLIRIADTSGIDPMAENLHEQVMTAVKAALKEVPELAHNGVGSGSLGTHVRTGVNTDDIAAKFRSGF